MIIERDDSLANLASEVLRVLRNLKSMRQEFLRSLQIILDAGKDLLQSDSTILSRGWTALYLEYMEYCSMEDQEILEWSKLSKDLMAIRQLDHTRFCGALLYTKLLNLKRASVNEKDWVSALGLLTSGDDQLVQVALMCFIPTLISTSCALVNGKPALEFKDQTTQRHFHSIIGASLEVFACERSEIKRNSCLSFFSTNFIFDLLEQDAKNELIILLKASLFTDNWNSERKRTPLEDMMSADLEWNPKQTIVNLIVRFLEDSDPNILQGCSAIVATAQHQQPWLFIKLMITIPKLKRQELFTDDNLHAYFESDTSTRLKLLWEYGDNISQELLPLLLQGQSQLEFSRIDLVISCWKAGSLGRLLSQLTDHTLGCKFLQEVITPELVLKLETPSYTWRSLHTILSRLRTELVETYLCTLLTLGNPEFDIAITQFLTKILDSLTAKPLVSLAASLQSEYLEWIACISALSPAIRLLSLIHDWMNKLEHSGKKREAMLLEKFRVCLGRAEALLGSAGKAARQAESLRDRKDVPEALEVQNLKRGELKVRSNSIRRGSSTGRSDTSIGPVRSHRRVKQIGFQLNTSSTVIKVPGLPIKNKETSAWCKKCSAGACKCNPSYTISAPFQAINPPRSPQEANQNLMSLKVQASSTGSGKQSQRPNLNLDTGSGSPLGQPPVSSSSVQDQLAHQSRFSIHLFSQPETPTSHPSTSFLSVRNRGNLPPKLQKLKRSTTFSESNSGQQSYSIPLEGPSLLLESEQSYNWTGQQSGGVPSKKRNSSLSGVRAQTESVLREVGTLATATPRPSFQITQPKKFRFIVTKNPASKEAETPKVLGPVSNTEVKKPPAHPRTKSFQQSAPQNENQGPANGLPALGDPLGGSSKRPPAAPLPRRLPSIGSQASR